MSSQVMQSILVAPKYLGKKQSTSPRTSTGKDDFFLKGAQALAGCELGTAAEQR